MLELNPRLKTFNSSTSYCTLSVSSYRETWKSTQHFVRLNNQISFKTVSGLLKLCVQYLKYIFSLAALFEMYKSPDKHLDLSLRQISDLSSRGD